MSHLSKLISYAMRAAAVCFLVIVALPAGAYALGLGDIVVKSAYSHGFIAEIPVFLEPGETDLKAAVGTQNDYNMIQIGRPPFIDALSVTVETAAAGKVILIVSKEPIDQPSFNLIIRASASGGNVLENYFLAVDFRKSLSLELPPPEEHAAEAPKEEKKGTQAASQLPPAAMPAAPEPAPVPAAPKRRETPKIAAAPKAAPEKPPAPAAAEKAPAEEGAAAYPAVVKNDANPANNQAVVKRGDTLFNIARTLHPAGKNLSRVVVSIYMENKDAFIDGNIHLLRAGVKLDYNRVNERATGISDEVARQLLSDNWKELKKPASAETGGAATVDLPFEKPPSAQEIADFLEQWRKEWVTNATGFGDRYASGFRGYRGHLRTAATKAEWIAIRRAFNESHDNMTVTITDIKTSRGGVSFTQTFASDQLFSVGQKTFALKREEGQLKIAEERIDIKRIIDRTHNWTVVFPTVQSREIAVAHLQKLRGLDSNVYETGFLPNGPYAAAAGRFATRALAEDFQKKLKAAGEQEAKVVLLPFSVRMKTTEDPSAAAAATAALAERGYFPFQMESAAADGKTRHIVCVGAFATREAAVQAGAALKIEGFEPQPVMP